ncbi:putative proline-rich receptor-like protein kinase PERK11 [Cynara cardunculus var. scolymus]|uniref:Uncharacterized protein n=1 Tax=Cynara cardunculus var. scolymus TaxID=59895 RepID=A0A124SFU2_CYNCS|nr:putative proline-rich receptor-like protein kinase PERK11 [Cynara cardunculus var. scolymus]KVI04303.1 hypothetical protein Ccrd_017378 [Cynara cardunculus var. scolymus]
MARTNKYTALNFNDIFEKEATSTANKHRRYSSFSSSSSTSLTTPPGNKTILSNSRIHGNMLVLNLPSPKPVTPPSQPSPPLSPAATQPPTEKDTISLRPLGRTGSGPPLSPLASSPSGQNKNLPISPKTNKFVPPHLRPGFLGREEKPGVDQRSNLRQGPNYDGEEGRPKTGGGYERMDTVGINRSRSIGSNRPNSSGLQ